MPNRSKPKKLIIDNQLAHGLGDDIADALSRYFKIDPSHIRVRNDETSPEHTLIDLIQVKRSAPKLKLRLQELARYKHTDIYYKADTDICDIELRIEDEIIVTIAEKILSQPD